jgi:hypothetical protein|tara:strand:- start:435 stop:875 length:441 start_codon:yes stop_codon:yes gene_type:complete
MGKNLKRVLEEYKTKIVSQLKDRLRLDDSVASGNLQRSIYGEVEGNTINIYASYYWYWVNYGRKANRTPPPYIKIYEWMEYRNIKQELKDYEKKRVAYFTAKAIGVLGYQGTKFIDYVNKNIITSLTKDVEESYLKDLNDKLDGNS